MTEPLHTPAEVADRCHCSTKTIMRAIHAGELEASQISDRKWIVRESAISDWLERRSNRHRAPRPLPDVRRVEPDVPTANRRRRSQYGDGSGRLAA